MSRSILIRGARQLVTLHGSAGPRRGIDASQLGVIEDGSLLITDGIITHVGPTRRIENLSEARSAEEMSANGRVVMPAFVDPFTRLVGPPPRVIGSPFGTATAEITQAKLASVARNYVETTPPVRLESDARRTAERNARHGTLSMLVQSGFGTDLSSETKALKAAQKAVDCTNLLTAFALEPHSEHSRQDYGSYAEWFCAEALPKVSRRKLARFVHGICDLTGYPPPTARAVLGSARQLGFNTGLVGDVQARTGVAELAAELETKHVVGLNYADESDAGTLARSRTMSVLVPGDVMTGRSDRFPPARLLLDAGAAVTLASGFCPTLPAIFGMQAVLSLACTYLNMAVEEAITAVTVNAAYAMDIAQTTGTLQYGKQADLLILEVSDYRAIAYNLGANLVNIAMRRGQIIYREGEVTCAAG